MAAVGRPTRRAAQRPRVLVVEDDPSMSGTLEIVLGERGYRVLKAGDAETAQAILRSRKLDVAVVDLGLPGPMTGLALLEWIRERGDQTQVVICTMDRDPATVVRAMRAGAFDYVTKDFTSLMTAPDVVDRAFASLDTGDADEAPEVRGCAARGGLVASETSPLQETIRAVARAAEAPTSVLLLGETGTGKELLARLLHQLSVRQNAPFVAINVASIPPTLLESALFGHERGAFTGAVERHIGKFEVAAGGTLFLDEIGELSRDVQSKILRVLQERQIERVGSRDTIEVDVRMVAATHVNLGQAVAAGTFRADLYYRLNVIPIEVPPLRMRREDLPPLCRHLAAKHAHRMGRAAISFTEAALERLREHEWPGNVRELENLVERLTVMSAQSEIGTRDLPPEYRGGAVAAAPTDGDALRAACDAFERDYILAALARSGHNKAQAARSLGIHYNTFKYRCAKLGIE
jgi:DNA-binding NtrC family response regulator